MAPDIIWIGSNHDSKLNEFGVNRTESNSYKFGFRRSHWNQNRKIAFLKYSLKTLNILNICMHSHCIHLFIKKIGDNIKAFLERLHYIYGY